MFNSSSRPKLLLRGIDSLYVSYFLDMATGNLNWDELGYQKERLKQTRNAGFAEITLGTERFALKPYGMKPYSFVLSSKSFEIRLSEHLKPGCYVQYFSEGLWTEGIEGLRKRFDVWCSSMGFRYTHPDTVSRADWAFDYDLTEVDFLPDHFVTRAVKNATWRERQTLQSIIFGTGDIVVRVYDKVAEIAQQSGKTWFYELWGQTENVWRIEFQIRRERLKEAGITTTEDLLSLQNDLLRELATNHTTLRSPSSDSNRSRWPVHSIWKALLDDIATLPQTGLVRHIDPQMPLDWRLRQQLKSLYGHLKGIGTIVALLSENQEVPDMEELLEMLPTRLDDLHMHDEWTDEIKRRITAYGLGQW